MAKVFKNFFKLASNDLANQYALPVKSLMGYSMTSQNSRKSAFLNKAVVDSLNIQSGHNILELGYGRGNALQYCMDKMGENGGLVCGIERSGYMEDVCRKRFILELEEAKVLRLDNASDLRNLPYPNDFFDRIFHVDVFYFIVQNIMPDVCEELFRVIKPGAVLMSGMQFSRLKRLTEWGLLNERQWDPLRYMMCLEPAGFVDVKIDYCDGPSGQKYELIRARKPEVDEKYFDPEARMKEMEQQIKKEILVNEILRTGKRLSKEDMDILKEL